MVAKPEVMVDAEKLSEAIAKLAAKIGNDCQEVDAAIGTLDSGMQIRIVVTAIPERITPVAEDVRAVTEVSPLTDDEKIAEYHRNLAVSRTRQCFP